MYRNMEVDTDMLQHDINVMKAQLQALRMRTKALEGKAAELNTMWEGPAHDTFSAEFSKDCTETHELLTEMERLVGHIQFSKGEYVSAEGRVQSAVKAIRI